MNTTNLDAITDKKDTVQMELIFMISHMIFVISSTLCLIQMLKSLPPHGRYEQAAEQYHLW